MLSTRALLFLSENKIMWSEAAVIFDMDGVLIENNAYHKAAWQEFLIQYKLPFSAEHLISTVWGQTNEDILKYVFSRELSESEILELEEVKESIYRKLYAPNITPLHGLIDFLKKLKERNIKTGIATSARKINLDFIVNGLGISGYIDVMVDGSMVKHGKPDPEVYILAANLLNVVPSKCFAFEDSFSGIKSANTAGMKVIGVTTTHESCNIENTIFNVADFMEVSIAYLEKFLRQ